MRTIDWICMSCTFLVSAIYLSLKNYDAALAWAFVGFYQVKVAKEATK